MKDLLGLGSTQNFIFQIVVDYKFIDRYSGVGDDLEYFIADGDGELPWNRVR